MAPSLVPSPRHLGGRRLLLASLTGSERRGDFVHGARPHAVAPSSRRTASPACIPDLEREEGRLRPWRSTSCRRSSSPRTSSPARIPDWEREEGRLRRLVVPAGVVSRRDNTLLSPNAPGGGDSSIRLASSSTTYSVTGPAQCFHDGKPRQCNLGVSSYGWFIMFICVFLSTTACQYATYLYFIILVILPVSPHANSSVSRVTSLMSTVALGLMAAKPLSQFLFSYLPVFYDACARTYWYTVVADIPRPLTSLGGAASPLPRPWSVVREGCVRHAFPRHTPSLKRKT